MYRVIYITIRCLCMYTHIHTRSYVQTTTYLLLFRSTFLYISLYQCNVSFLIPCNIYIFIIFVCKNTVTNHIQNVYNNNNIRLLYGYLTKSYRWLQWLENKTKYIFCVILLFLRRGMMYDSRNICITRRSFSTTGHKIILYLGIQITGSATAMKYKLIPHFQ
jgi:hypothetical protein